jgi:hypothetical protein
LDVQWIKVNPGKVFVGSNNRSILFGGIGPRHEVRIDYEFEMSFLPVPKATASQILLSDEYNIASESEWTLAFEQDLISGNNEVEELADRIRGSYWSKVCDGRPFFEEGWLMKSSRSWSSGNPSPSQISRGQVSEFIRLVKRPKDHHFLTEGPQLPVSSNKYRLLREEFLIALIVGIIPSFIWAYFNASEGYISEGWLNLLFGGLFVGVFTVIFWRPSTVSWRVGNNCGKMKPV